MRHYTAQGLQQTHKQPRTFGVLASPLPFLAGVFLLAALPSALFAFLAAFSAACSTFSFATSAFSRFRLPASRFFAACSESVIN